MKLHANVEALSIDTHGEFILVGDMIRSMSLVKLQDPANSIFQKVAADYNPCWMTSVKILQDDIFLGAETYYNLFTARRISDIEMDEESETPMHLEIVGEYHLGDQVNCFREGTERKRKNDRNVVSTRKKDKNGMLSNTPRSLKYRIINTDNKTSQCKSNTYYQNTICYCKWWHWYNSIIDRRRLSILTCRSSQNLVRGKKYWQL